MRRASRCKAPPGAFLGALGSITAAAEPLEYPCLPDREQAQIRERRNGRYKARGAHSSRTVSSHAAHNRNGALGTAGENGAGGNAGPICHQARVLGGLYQNAASSNAIIEPLPALIARKQAVACGRTRSKKKVAVLSLAS